MFSAAGLGSHFYEEFKSSSKFHDGKTTVKHKI